MGDTLKTFGACANVAKVTATKVGPAIVGGYTKAAYKGTSNAVEESLEGAPSWLRTAAGATAGGFAGVGTAVGSTVLAVVATVVTPFAAAADDACDDFVQDSKDISIGALADELYREVAPDSADFDDLRENGLGEG